MYFHKLACGIYYPFVYKNTTRGTIFTSSTRIYNHMAFPNFYGLMVYFTTFCSIFNILSYSNDGGGGGYVVKRYPSIDPIAAPPPPPRYN